MSCNNIIDYAPANMLYKKAVGDSFSLSLTFTDSDNAAIDLSDATGIDFYVDDAIVADLDAGITVGGDDNNIVTIIKDDDRAAGNYNYKLTVTDGGAVRTYIKGKLIIL